MSKKLFLHIGARKTGSSFLQTMFTRNAENFLKQGLYYPLDKANATLAMQGYTTSGNGHPLRPLLRPDEFLKSASREEVEDRFLAMINSSPCSNVLISSEWLCAAREQALARFKQIADAARIKVEIIYFVRNPLDYAFSEWTQNIKDGKEFCDWRMFLRHHAIPFGYVIDRFRKHVDDGLHVLNYDRCKGSLLETVCDIAGVTPDNSGQDMVVNRTPTKTEAELILYINKFLADAEAAPKDQKSLSDKIYKQMIMRPARDRMRPVVTGDDLSVLECNNAERLVYVNKVVSNGALSLYEGEVATGELVLNLPPEETRVAIDAILAATLSMIRTQNKNPQHSRAQDPENTR